MANNRNKYERWIMSFASIIMLLKYCTYGAAVLLKFECYANTLCTNSHLFRIKQRIYVQSMPKCSCLFKIKHAVRKRSLGTTDLL